jgi:perosamine synthetase
LVNFDSDSIGNWKIPLYKIYTDDEDLKMISNTIKRGTNWALGPEIEEFEKAIADYVGRDYCLVLNSGTSALHALFLAYGFNSDSEIIVPSFSFISTANSVLFVGAKPVFADIEKENFGLDPSGLSKLISSKTKAIVPMDYGGLSCKIFELKDFADANNIILIEDAAEALGSTVKGHKVGSVPESAMFSFAGNKVLTTGEGGAIVSDSKEIYEKIKLIRSHGRQDLIRYFDNPNSSDYVGLGYNWRMSSLTAAIGLSQLSKLDKLISLRQQNANYLSSRLSKIKDITIPKVPENYQNIYQLYSILLPNKTIRDNLHRFLENKRIFSKIYFEPIHLSSFYKDNMGIKSFLPVTETISERILTLPMYPNFTMEEKNYLIESISEFFENKN